MDKMDHYIIEWICQNGPATPKEISEDQKRENVIRIRCENLVKDGAIQRITHELYSLTEHGLGVATKNDSIEPHEKAMFKGFNRITDFSEIDPEDIKWRNRRYFENRDHHYEPVTPHTQRKIANVRNGDLNRVMEEFPYDDPLTEQCAHWVRAIIGLHFFPDANHRTAMAILNALLQLNGLDRIEWEGKRYQTAIFKSKLIRRLVIDVRFDNLWCKDELYTLWHRYFTYVLYDVPSYNHQTPNVPGVEQILEKI